MQSHFQWLPCLCLVSLVLVLLEWLRAHLLQVCKAVQQLQGLGLHWRNLQEQLALFLGRQQQVQELLSAALSVQPVSVFIVSLQQRRWISKTKTAL